MAIDYISGTRTTTAVNGGNDRSRELKELPIRDLVLDPLINRTVDQRWADKIAEQFNEYALGLFTVWQREDGSYAILDGQHRYRGAEKHGWAGKVACYVHHGLTEAAAAELFLEINAQRNVSAIDKFKKAVQAGHPYECEVAEVLDDYELVVGILPGDIGSPSALLAVRMGGGVLLRRFVDTLTTGFADTPKAQALHGEVMSGLLLAVKKYGKVKPKDGTPSYYKLDLEHLGTKLAETTMVELFASRDLKARQNPQYTKRWHMAGQLVEEYNRGESRSAKLEAWTYRAA